jgi:hypothetical protein
MKRVLCTFAAVLALCGALVFSTAARAKAECTTQGAMALALAEMLKLNVTTADAAVTALAALGIAPDGGWKVEECLTAETTAQIRAAYAAAVTKAGGAGNLTAGAFDAALESLTPAERSFRDVSPSKP